MEKYQALPLACILCMETKSYNCILNACVSQSDFNLMIISGNGCLLKAAIYFGEFMLTI